MNFLKLSVYCYTACITFVGPAIVSQFLEDFFPLKNGSYPQLYPLHSEFLFFEQSDYYFLTCLHIFFICLCMITVIAATDTMYLFTVRHVAALFSIVS